MPILHPQIMLSEKTHIHVPRCMTTHEDFGTHSSCIIIVLFLSVCYVNQCSSSFSFLCHYHEQENCTYH